MKRGLGLLAVASVVGGLIAVSALGQKPKPVAGWLLDYAAARETARRTGKPLFVVFH